MATTSQDVARAAGVSRPAVSQILNGRGRFTPETVARVRATAERLGYHASAAARSLATGTSDVVVALVPDTTFGTNLQDSFDVLTRALAEAGLTLVLRLSSSPINLLERFVKATSPRAVLTLTPLPPPVRTMLAGARIPVIGDAEHGAMEHLNRRIGRLQATELIAAGYSHFAYAQLHDSRPNLFGQAREAAFSEACAAAGFRRHERVSLGLTPADAIHAMSHLPEQVGIACYNDDVAVALMDACRVSKRDIPGDVGLVGVDATAISRLVWPRLTTISIDYASITAQVSRSLIDELKGQPSPLEQFGSVTTLKPGETVKNR